ncbi:ARM repeat-containing protein [Peniophora sp. CONT]|nr:ARM repeat-containing protein [Peniophora sp. CONT]
MNSGVVYPSLNAPSPGSYPHRLHPDRRRGGQQAPQGYRDRSVDGPRSAILEDFRANKSRRWELKDILGHVVEFSVDQHGSRFIQHRLDTAGPDVRQKAFDEIVPQQFMALVENVFGNYVIQKLFEHGTGPQKAAMMAAMETHILQLSLHMYGCRVVQKAIDFVGPDLQGIFVRELKDEVMRCVKDPNGNHVVQKLIERVPPERLSFIASFVGNVYELASHPYGCRVLQRCLEHLGLDATRPLLDELQKYITDLMQDQFGNYVVQFLCENGEQTDRAIVVEKLRGHLLTMSKHKFASNVVEKVIVTSDSAGRELLIDEIMLTGEEGQDSITLMMKDQYANYVLQRAMMHAEGQQQVDLCNRVRPQLVAMRKLSSVYTKHLNSSAFNSLLIFALV